MTEHPLTEQFIHGIVNFRDCWYARFDMHNCCDEDFWEWISTGYYDMYVHPFPDYDPWNLTGREGALNALDRLYEENDEGLRRLSQETN